MGFFAGLFFGVAFGIGFIVCIARYQIVRSARRADLAAIIAAFARMTVADSRKLLPGEYYPPWVVFAKRQKLSYILFIIYFCYIMFCSKMTDNWYPKFLIGLGLNWLNLQLNKIWPYVDEVHVFLSFSYVNLILLGITRRTFLNCYHLFLAIAASDLIRSSVEPILEQYKPIILSSMKFSKLTLGTVAPQFTGVSVNEGDPGEITMELEMQWDGNPNVVLDILTRVGVALPIQVKNIAFTGLFRLIFKPLVAEFPCFGAVLFSLREKKQLDFTLKVIGGDLSALPGVSEAIEETIKDAVEDSITWPVRVVIPIIAGDYSDLELKPAGILEVKLIEAKELTNKDIIGKSDPYATLFVRPLRDRMKSSKTIVSRPNFLIKFVFYSYLDINNNQLNPIWNEHFEFTVEDPITQHFTIRVFDDEGVQASELIGCGQVAIKDLEPGKVKDIWIKLVKDLVIQRDNKNRGMVHLELLYCPFGTESGLQNPFDPDFRLTDLEKALKSGISETDVDPAKLAAQKKKEVIVRGVLSVTVMSAQDLPAVDLLGKSDPYVVINNTLNPVWNQTFDFVIEDGLRDLLMCEVWDHDTFGKDKMGKCIMTLTRVILEGEFTETFNLDGCKAGKLTLHLKWTPQTIVRD
ncbi:C2 calcium-dependent membrane targeting [Cynara cardunculus var. scolymus]|uniref:C2 calcium-dependent membrane targeting n=1 Tax=Cynara cardunculus var. scolymus TaxID=59895 RepID=A0A103XC11_CYNCS|nr:C2 calcium-dependent membrane targeting [Cynara cardunculus var. scolymus]